LDKIEYIVKNLNEILDSVEIVSKTNWNNCEIKNIHFDSRKVAKNDLFVAIVGLLSDGHNFINKAIENGASVIVCENLPENLNEKVIYCTVKNSSAALAIIATNYFDHPSKNIQLVGITGTNGKTSIATHLYKLFSGIGFKCGLLSTVENIIDGESIASTHTTPDPIQLNSLLSKMLEIGCEYCFMEVSSHAIVQHRIGGLYFAGAIFTNLTHEHLDYHKTFKEYLNAKKLFFDNLPKAAFALINIDDKNAKVMVQNCLANTKTYALKSFADFSCKILELSFEGMLLKIEKQEIWTKFIGEFNAYNFLAVYSTAILLKAKREEILPFLSNLDSVKGRFEIAKSKSGKIAIVDYAHTPDALKNVLKAIKNVKNSNKIIAVVGAGGNRDKSKRPLMAKIVAENSDLAIFTSDNPRNENPDEIINDMVSGIEQSKEDKIIAIKNRKEAIKTACIMASKQDIILIAGKGHECTQEIQGVKYPFDDKEIFSNLNC
jgi:UDP-N-acetylmuramoyl-L-alanyl-D-glutamate--2,6-diaminopimelate ligase